MSDQPKPVHPGEILAKEYMQPLGLTVNGLARDLHVPPNRIHRVVRGQCALTADTALRLARYFGTPAEMWMVAQARYDLAVTEEALGRRLQREVLPREEISDLEDDKKIAR